MTKKQKVLFELKIAELQFRLASTVRLSVTNKIQPLDVPTEWVHGVHKVVYKDIVLRDDQAEIASDYLQRTTTFLMAMLIRNALKKQFDNPKLNTNKNVISAYQIARLIRNAFAHSPIKPIWYIDEDCKNKKFSVENIISLNTRKLDKKPFDWRHYGGHLALLKLSKYVRIKILGDTDTGENRLISKPKKIYYQIGNLILKKINKLPKGVKILK